MRRTYVELFAGAGGLSLGLNDAGWRPIAHAEIERHARAVLRDKWPFLPLHGDVRQIDWTQYRGAVDLVAGGSPCQDLSIAGKRSGLAGERSGLFYELVRAWNETAAPYCLWENVDGCRSSNNGRDFAAVLSAFLGVAVAVPADGWRSSGVAAGPHAVASWRVLDLQEFAIPQRRTRVFMVVARTGGVDPAEVLGLTSPDGERQPTDEQVEGPFWNGGTVVPALDISGIVKQQTMPEKGRLWAVRGEQWVPVVWSAEVDEDLEECPQCGGTYPDCPCPRPTQDYPYRETDGQLEALVPWLRRLTPIECERLMSWPDRWTEVGRDDNGTVYKLPDTARYKLCGNGVGSVVAEWIGRRIIESLENAAKDC